jgi:hypothetical protein
MDSHSVERIMLPSCDVLRRRLNDWECELRAELAAVTRSNSEFEHRVLYELVRTLNQTGTIDVSTLLDLQSTELNEEPDLIRWFYDAHSEVQRRVSRSNTMVNLSGA